MEETEQIEGYDVLRDVDTVIILPNILDSVKNGEKPDELDIKLLTDCMCALKESFDGKNLDIAVQLYEISMELKSFSVGDISYLRSYIFNPLSVSFDSENKVSDQRKKAVDFFVNSLLNESANISPDDVSSYKKKARTCLKFVFESLNEEANADLSRFNRAFVTVLDDIIDEISTSTEVAAILEELSEARSVEHESALATLGCGDGNDTESGDDGSSLGHGGDLCDSEEDDDYGPFLKAFVPLTDAEKQDNDIAEYRAFIANLDIGVVPEAWTRDELLDYLMVATHEFEQLDIVTLKSTGRDEIAKKYGDMTLKYVEIIDSILIAEYNAFIANLDIGVVPEGWTREKLLDYLLAATRVFEKLDTPTLKSAGMDDDEIAEKYGEMASQYGEIIDSILDANEIPLDVDAVEALIYRHHLDIENGTGSLPPDDAKFLISGEYDIPGETPHETPHETPKALDIEMYADFLNALDENSLYLEDTHSDSAYLHFLDLCLDKQLKENLDSNIKQGCPQAPEKLGSDFNDRPDGPRMVLTRKLNSLLNKRHHKPVVRIDPKGALRLGNALMSAIENE